MNALAPLLWSNAAVVAACVAVLWGVSLVLRNASIADVWWGAGFVVVGWNTLRLSEVSSHGLLLLLFSSLWGVRLTVHVGVRNLIVHGARHEDRRYAAMRKAHGARFWMVSLFSVFLLQGVLLLVISLPLQLGIHIVARCCTALSLTGGFSALDRIGAAVFAFGFGVETVADEQLRRFARAKKGAGAVLSTGLWRYSRHPNYFGELVLWWGIFIVAVQSTGAWWTIAGPLTISFLLLRVSGVPMIERDIAARRPEYAAYLARTSTFWPRLPR